MSNFKHVEEQIALLHDRRRKCLKCYMNDICNYCQERIAAADTMQALLDVARAAEVYRLNVGLPSATKTLFAFDDALAKLQEKTCAGCGNKWNHDTVWCPECAIKRADKLQEHDDA